MKKMKLIDLFESNNETLDLKELMEVHGGADLDSDLEEECITLQCIVSSNFQCIIAKCIISS